MVIEWFRLDGSHSTRIGRFSAPASYHAYHYYFYSKLGDDSLWVVLLSPHTMSWVDVPCGLDSSRLDLVVTKTHYYYSIGRSQYDTWESSRTVSFSLCFVLGFMFLTAFLFLFSIVLTTRMKKWSGPFKLDQDVKYHSSSPTKHEEHNFKAPHTLHMFSTQMKNES